MLPGCAAVLAWVAQTVSDDRLTGGAPVLVSMGLVPHGVAALREPVESWAFYDHTQHVTALMLCVQTAQLSYAVNALFLITAPLILLLLLFFATPAAAAARRRRDRPCRARGRRPCRPCPPCPSTPRASSTTA